MLMELETLKQSFLDLTSDAVAIGEYVGAGDGVRVVYINPAFTKLFGYQEDDVIGRPVTELAGSASSSPFSFLQNRVQMSDHRPPDMVRVHTADGTRLPISVSAFGCHDGERGKHIVGATFRDMSGTTYAGPLPGSPESDRSDGPGIPPQSYEDLLADHTRLLSALNAYPDPIVIYDKDQILVYRNDGYAASMADDITEIVPGMHLRDVLRSAIRHGRYPAAVGREEDWINEILSPSTLFRPLEDVELDGDVHHRLFRNRSINDDYIIIRLNSTELVREKRAAEAIKARLIAALNAYPAPFVIYDAEDCLVVCNDAYRASMANDPNDLKEGMHRTEVARIAIRAGKIANAIGREEEWMSDAHQQEEVEKPVQDLELPGDVHHRLLRSRVENGDLVILRIDTTELVRHRRMLEQNSEKLEKANSEITYMALHDDLTGLANRRYLAVKYEELVKKRAETGGDLAALHIDLDRFKQINDTMGHRAGDNVLVEVSRRISGRLSADEFVARIGGDEFVVLLHVPSGSSRPQDLGYLLLNDLSKPTYFESRECRFGASIGLAQTPLAGTDELLTNSDVALYKAKRNGRGQLAVFDQSDLADVRRAKALADDVLRGIEQEEFEPYYQPQIDARSGRILGVEALARWRHPELGLLPPAEFLEVARELNVDSDIDRLIFEKAIAECAPAFAGKHAGLALSFNVSERRISHADLEILHRHVRDYSGQICFELLETIFLEEQDDAFLERLRLLKELGISIEVDDFGSGRASVVALQKINPDRLKIDRRLASLVTKGSAGLRLLRSIIEIAQALDLGVTAEGVETAEQAEILTKLGCDQLQGYHFGKPMPFADLLRHLEQEPDRTGGQAARADTGAI
ncbi:GGDEF and EAL domain-containing protein [Roseibium denhamense]|uniref:PAS domain S-box-containing protein/diguanylate cyclase (GGDEF) domain-containing protein n=1 Tax=Roseibium denhamense TaxID=76305 RepID=A0ABY1N9L4_9HYPH|nr:EAL domain-containing protein [Roseibium denhamense]MTI05687.1 GGDEF and EAL domain-containing protein [Roseibium denhamense]SMP04196.1 PAS domain S-box-containing protein/diguanylate cyclase (GGDEF) domain-containing protein [Roseibium denhamense]